MNTSTTGPNGSSSLSLSVHSSIQNELQVSDQKNSNLKASITFKNYIIKHLLDVSLPVLSSKDQEILQKYLEEIPQSIKDISIDENSVSFEPVRKKARYDANNNAQLEIKEATGSINVFDSIPFEVFATIFNHLSKEDIFSFKNCNQRNNESVKGFWKDRKVLYTSNSKLYNCLEFDSRFYPNHDSFKYLEKYLSWCLKSDRYSITSLKFNSLNWITDDHLIQLLPAFKQIHRLETLIVNGCTQITGKFMWGPDARYIYSCLKVLNFANCSNIQERFIELEDYENLIEADISTVSLKDDEFFIKILTCNKLLSKLSIRFATPIDEELFNSLKCFIASTVCLSELHIYLSKQNSLTEKQIKDLNHLKLPIIRYTNFGRNPYGSDYEIRSNSVNISYHYDSEVYDSIDSESDGYDSQSGTICIN